MNGPGETRASVVRPSTTGALAFLKQVLENPLLRTLEEEEPRPLLEMEMPSPTLVAQLSDEVLAAATGGIGWTLDDGRSLRLAAACFLDDAWQDRHPTQTRLQA